MGFLKKAGSIPILILAVSAAVCAAASAMALSFQYSRVLDYTDGTAAVRTAHAYLTNKIRQAKAVSVINFEATPAVRLDIGEPGYAALVYQYDGMLYELFASDDSGLLPEDGTPLFPMDSLQISEHDGAVDLAYTLPEQAPEHLFLYIGGDTY